MPTLLIDLNDGFTVQHQNSGIYCTRIKVNTVVFIQGNIVGLQLVIMNNYVMFCLEIASN